MTDTVFCPECSDVHARDDAACPIVNGTIGDTWTDDEAEDCETS